MWRSQLNGRARRQRGKGKDDSILYQGTGIHARINTTLRISSIYRDWGIAAAPVLCGWETIVWDGEQRIFYESTSGNAQDVVERHAELYRRAVNGEALENPEE